MTEPVTLMALLVASFLSATVLPGGSEVVLTGVLLSSPALAWPALGVATLGNTLGGMSSFALGWLLPNRHTGRTLNLAHHWMRKAGPPILLLSWVPVIGDALCVAAGWVRCNPWQGLLYMALGKFTRYAIIVWMLK